ncbi:hypothetical protein JTB14_004362 [Gonioctena quinquepunctata]|nr:hypothetical protein JTB14_004362 [Gonioctena quinquepunctata]
MENKEDDGKTDTKFISSTETDIKMTPTSDHVKSSSDISKHEKLKEEVKYFQCSTCIFKEKYEYFGSNPSLVKNYILLEDAYVIEDPFTAPKQGKIIILGSHCIVCRKAVCKDANCSIYFDGSYCIECAKHKKKNKF